MKEKTNKLNFSKLFYNDKFVMLFSVILAFIIWVNLSVNSQETRYLTVTDIPISLPELGNDLHFFGTDNLTAEVRISGNSLVVASVTSSDIYITAADTSQLTSPGNYTLNLVPKKGSIKSDYNFDSTVRPSTINTYIDRYAEKEIAITDRIDVSAVDSEHYAAKTQLSRQTINVKGAEAVINSIAEADAEYTFTDPISETQTVEAIIVLRDSKGEKIDTQYITTDAKTVTAAVPILKIKTIPIVPNITNAPDSFVFDEDIISVEPSTIEVAIPDDATENISSISTDEIDLSKVNLTNNHFNVGLQISSGLRNLKQITEAEVTFDKSKLAEKKITLSKFTIINDSPNRKTNVSTKSIDVVLIGEKNQINTITASNITAVIDMSSKISFSGYGSMPVTISINSKFPSVWTYGTYEVDVNVADTTQTSSSPS